MTTFLFTYRQTDINQFEPMTKSLLSARDDELELYLREADPVGRICQWHAAIAAPDGWLLANGASLAVVDYRSLFAVIGYTYGGAGANFTLPTVTDHIIRY